MSTKDKNENEPETVNRPEAEAERPLAEHREMNKARFKEVGKA